jgi:predicted ATP-grasp superfamily ATP-dependent carboligase
MFVSEFGKAVQASIFQGTTLVIPCLGAGMAPYIALDLFVLNQNLERVGFYHSDYLAPIVLNDTQTPASEKMGKINCPAEFFVCKERNLTFFALRAPPAGSMRKFTDELNVFIKEMGFANVILLSSTMSEVKRERDTNRKVPEVFAYLNNYFWHTPQGKTYYSDNNIRKFGHWIEEIKRKPH